MRVHGGCTRSASGEGGRLSMGWPSTPGGLCSSVNAVIVTLQSR